MVENLRNEINVSSETLKENYSAYMTTPGNYGTTTELCAAAELFGFRFNIVKNGGSDFHCYDYGFSVNADVSASKPVACFLLAAFLGATFV